MKRTSNTQFVDVFFKDSRFSACRRLAGASPFIEAMRSEATAMQTAQKSDSLGDV